MVLQSMFDLAGKTKLQWVHHNPKKLGTAAHARFEAYRGSTTVAQFFAHGGAKGDLRYDMEKGYVSVKKSWTEHPIRRKTNMKGSVSRNLHGAFASRSKVVVKVYNSKKKNQQSNNNIPNRLSSSSTIEEK